MDQSQYIELEVINTNTILLRIIMIIKKRRINIKSFFAEINHADSETARFKMVLEVDAEKIRLLKTQFEKVLDVVSVN